MVLDGGGGAGWCVGTVMTGIGGDRNARYVWMAAAAAMADGDVGHRWQMATSDIDGGQAVISSSS